MSGDDRRTPRLRGEVIEGLRRATSRECGADPTENARADTPTQVSFGNARERAAVTLAAMILDELAAAGGSCVDRKVLGHILDRCAKHIPEQELMRLEIEAHQTFEWLASTLAPSGHYRSKPLEKVFPNTQPREVMRWGIHYGHDLTFSYWDKDAGELAEHTVTPMALEADKYLRAISHTTKDERIFESRRIAELRPARGWPVRHREGVRPPHAPAGVFDDGARPHDASPRSSTPRPQEKGQMSLLGEEEE